MVAAIGRSENLYQGPARPATEHVGALTPAGAGALLF